MQLKDFDYILPKNLIAQKPKKPRDHSRLLVLDKKNRAITHKHFYNITDYFNAGDILVLNNSKVFPARLIGKKKATGGKIEIFLLKKIRLALTREKKGEIWQCLIGGKVRKENLEITFSRNLKAKIIKDNGDGTWQVLFNKTGDELMAVVGHIGKVPLPPYIKRGDATDQLSKKDKNNYQTVYADEKKLGSVAAPTAGLHFTPALINNLKRKGIQIIYVTLHVGLGTFAPVKTKNIKDHKMHSEWVEIKKNALIQIIKAKQSGKRIIAVGTTSVRTLETAFNRITNYELRITNKSELPNSKISKFSSFYGYTNIFIYPGYKFKAIDGLITNFHLPQSTLLMLVSALAGKKNIDKAYKTAIKNKYRFFSYGDAMLII